jgi:hypothetical protein
VAGLGTGKAPLGAGADGKWTGTGIDIDNVTARGGVIPAVGGKRFCLQKHSLIFLFTSPSSPS